MGEPTDMELSTGCPCLEFADGSQAEAFAGPSVRAIVDLTDELQVELEDRAGIVEALVRLDAARQVE